MREPSGMVCLISTECSVRVVRAPADQQGFHCLDTFPTCTCFLFPQVHGYTLLAIHKVAVRVQLDADIFWTTLLSGTWYYYALSNKSSVCAELKATTVLICAVVIVFQVTNNQRDVKTTLMAFHDCTEDVISISYWNTWKIATYTMPYLSFRF